MNATTYQVTTKLKVKSRAKLLVPTIIKAIVNLIFGMRIISKEFYNTRVLFGKQGRTRGWQSMTRGEYVFVRVFEIKSKIIYDDKFVIFFNKHNVNE